MFGIQTWVALPKSREEIEPAFAHHAQAELPEMEGEGLWSRIILGTCFGRSSPVVTYADPVYVDCLLDAGARVSLPAEIEERAVSIVSGELQVGNQRFVPGTLAVFTPKAEVVLTTDVATHSFSSVGPSWTARELSGGILSHLRRNGSKRQKPTGATGASHRCPATMSLFRFRSERVSPSLCLR